jgi:hypothetical protein
MPEITLPDGRKLRFTAPDGMSHDDILKYAQKYAQDNPVKTVAPGKKDTEAPGPWPTQDVDPDKTPGGQDVRRDTAKAAIAGARERFGDAPFGLSPQSQNALAALGITPSPGNGGPIRYLNKAIIDTFEPAGELAMRAGAGLVGAYQGGVSQLGQELGAPLAGREAAALPEAFPQAFAGNRLRVPEAKTANPLASWQPPGPINRPTFVPPETLPPEGSVRPTFIPPETAAADKAVKGAAGSADKTSGSADKTSGSADKTSGWGRHVGDLAIHGIAHLLGLPLGVAKSVWYLANEISRKTNETPKEPEK